MKFVIPTQELNYLVNKCLNVISIKGMPILSNLLIEAHNNEITITATDLTVGIRCFTEAKILEEGATTVPAKKFAQLIRELTAANVEIALGKNEITEIHAASSHFKLNGMSKNDFPSLPNMQGAEKFKVQQKELKDMLFRTAFAVSREDNRYALTGVHMHIAQSKATFTGTDGKRLARNSMDIDLDPTFSHSYIIPLKAVEEILKNLSEEGDATLFLMQDKIAILASQTMIITKLLSGDYPDVQRVIPDELSTVLQLHREELTSLLRQISLFTADNSHSVRFTFSNGELKLSVNTTDIGEGRVSMPVNYVGDDIHIAFNPIFFLDVLRHCRGETVSMGFSDPHNPAILSDQENGDLSKKSSPLFVLMPMRLTER